MHLKTPLLTLLAIPTLAALANAHVRVDSPNGGEMLQGQQIHAINWVDIIDHGTLVTYEIEFSADGGSSWTQVVDGLTYTGGISTYDWLVPDQTTSQGRIRVTMHVDPITTYSDSSNANFAVDASYTSYGAGTPVNGVLPILMMHNVPQSGASILIHLSQAEVGADAHILVGSQQMNQTFSGVTLLNNRDLAHLVMTVDNNGEVFLPITLPAGATGVTAHVQIVVASTPNLSATDGARFTVLP
ncbi:MAG: hypothetical protein COA70_08505 [Planctomycetota bacterium]|nr:MAG: hypothetical protein COA70_08505 [Planctomycetota bacterium]